MITFLIIYCPRRVRPKGACENIRSGKKRNGKKVRIIWINASFKANFTKRWPIKNNPIKVSQTASKIMDISGVRIPNVNCSMVALAISSAGLTPYKEFEHPEPQIYNTYAYRNEVDFLFFYKLGELLIPSSYFKKS